VSGHIASDFTDKWDILPTRNIPKKEPFQRLVMDGKWEHRVFNMATGGPIGKINKGCNA
jgi:hypothetical protein